MSENNFRAPRLVFHRNEFIAELVKGKEVLDIGCVDHNLENRNVGYWLHGCIAETASRVVGMDYEAEEVEKLKAEGYNAVVGDATNFDLGEQFDVVVAGELIEHLVNLEGFLNSVRKHLKPGGMLITSTPNANSIIYSIESLVCGREIDNPDHVCLYSPTTIRTLFDKCDFDLKSVHFVAENTTYAHKKLFFKALAQLRQALQVTVGYLRPSVCHGFITTSTPR